MVKRFVRDESGVALGLAVIMIVLIGVMGAGLLVFVRNDLEAVVEVNQGQRAMEAASAGVQAAEGHLSLEDNSKESYDTANGDSEWSFNQGKDLNFDGDSATVTIRYLTPSTTEAAARSSNNAPEVDASGQYENNRKYFKMVSRGEAGGAVRKIEAIYRTTDYELPIAYYATGNIDFNGNATNVEGVSLFARGNVTNVRGANITGDDQAYGNWAEDPDTLAPNDYNATSRGTTTAGIGALGTIGYTPSVPPRYDTVDYDTNTDPKFVHPPTDPQPDTEITFPFPSGSAANDDEIIDALRKRAMAQDNYVSLPSGGSLTIEDGALTENYPPNSDLETVFFVEFADGAKGGVTYKADTTNLDGYSKGTVVVVNGDLTTSPSADPFEGVFVVRDPDDADLETMNYTNSGNTNIKGFANVEGDVKLSGDISTTLTSSLVDGIPGLYETEQWSWRELYQ